MSVLFSFLFLACFLVRDLFSSGCRHSYEVKCSFELLHRDLVKLNLPKQKNILSKDEWAALSDLRSDDSIIITRPDKGNGVVIVSRLDYRNKMKKLISDGTKFKQLKQHSTKSREESLSGYLCKIKKDGMMTQHSTRFYQVDLLLVFYMVCQRFTRLDALSAQLFPLWTPTITILLPSSLAYFNQFPPTNTRLKIRLVLQIGPKHTNITTEQCALWMSLLYL